MSKLEKFALAIQKHEGYYPGSLAYKNNNPGNMIMGELAKSFGAKDCYKHPRTGHCFAIFPTYEQGFSALCKLLENAFSGKSSIYKPDWTILEFFTKYSPVRDAKGNIIPNKNYAQAVADEVGVSINTKIKDLLDNPITSNNMYFRYGHQKENFVKVGDKVKKGQKIGTVGNGNGQYVNASHCHFDCPKNKLAKWTDYVFGMTSKQVEELYANPEKYRDTVAPWFDHYGWMYLEYATYGTKTCYHPGADLNGKGAGDSDSGLPLYSACNGEVIYVYDGTGTNGGWGKLIVIEEKKEEPAPAPDPCELLKKEIEKLKTEKEGLLNLISQLTSDLEQCKDVMYGCLNSQTKCDHSITELLNMLISKILWRKK